MVPTFWCGSLVESQYDKEAERNLTHGRVLSTMTLSYEN